MIKVSVRLSGYLQRQGLPGGFIGGTLELPEPSTVADALRALEIGPRSPWLIAHNGRIATPDALLRDGDALVIIPPISGGADTKEWLCPALLALMSSIRSLRRS